MSPIRPSKRLLEHTSEMINKQQIFNLIDDQIAAYNSIMSKAKSLVKSAAKSVVIVKGGPGTGKSVIALEVMGELMRQGRTVFHATGSSAFTNTLRKIVGTRARSLFKFFNSFINAKPDSIEILICDEAHRVRKNSNSRYTRREDRSSLPQIDELLRLAKLSIFFIDENQIVRPDEIGSVSLIKEAAARFGVGNGDIAEFELKTQFRCSGSDAYLQWLDKTLGISDAEEVKFDARMEFKIFSDPSTMMAEIRKRNAEKKNSARIVAGFCWPWSEPNSDGSLVSDVRIGDFAMPWEKKDTFWKWATDDSGMEQVGTVYTAQGFEFDYIGVIFGNDLVYDSDKQAMEKCPAEFPRYAGETKQSGIDSPSPERLSSPHVPCSSGSLRLFHGRRNGAPFSKLSAGAGLFIKRDQREKCNRRFFRSVDGDQNARSAVLLSTMHAEKNR